MNTDTWEFIWTVDWTGNAILRLSTIMDTHTVLLEEANFNICTKTLGIFDKSVVESEIYFAAICWDSSIRARDSKKRNKLIKKVGSVLGTALAPLDLNVKRRMLHLLVNIKNSTDHPLHYTMSKQQSQFEALPSPAQISCVGSWSYFFNMSLKVKSYKNLGLLMNNRLDK